MLLYLCIMGSGLKLTEDASPLPVSSDLVSQVNSVKNPECKKALKALCDVFALTRIQSDIMFRNDDYVAPSKAKAIGRVLLELCSELRYVAVRSV